MGLIDRMLSVIFGGGNVIRDTAEVFRENAEAQAGREARLSEAAIAQFAAEFVVPRKGVFDRFMDGVNRVPRPALALGTLGLFLSAMIDPLWFAARMEGIALVPEPLWWLLGAIVSFYFGARHQLKGQDFQRSIAATLAHAAHLRQSSGPGTVKRVVQAADLDGETAIEALRPTDNAAVDEWRRLNGR